MSLQTSTEVSVHFFMVRHGQTYANSMKPPVAQGHIDNEVAQLNPIGEDQAAKAAFAFVTNPYLKDRKFAAIYYSPLGRCQKTAEFIQKEVKSTIFQSSSGLLALGWGIYDGKSVDEKVRENIKRDDDWAPEGGESRSQVRKRLLATIQDFAKSHSGQNIILTLHNEGILPLILMKEMIVPQGVELPSSIPNGAIVHIELTKDAEFKLHTIINPSSI